MNNMPDKEFEILSYLREHDNIAWVDVLNAFGDYPETHRILKAMLGLGITKISSPGEAPPHCHLTLTDRGYQTALAEEDLRNKLANKMTNEKANQKSDRRFQLLNSLLSAIVGSIITLLIEHFPTILNALEGFCRWFIGLF